MSGLTPLLSVLGIGLGAYLAVVGVLWVAQPYLLYQPHITGASGATPADVGLPYDDVRIETDDGVSLSAWFVPPPEPDGAVVLFFHGNAGDIGDRLETLEMLREAGAGVLIIDYRGYGESGGRPSEQGTYADAAAAWQWLTREAGVGRDRIVVFGRSLGAAIAAHLAAATNPAGLMLEAAFTSAPELAADLYPWLPARWLTRFRYDTKAYLQSVECPVLLAHAEGDDIVPFAHARRLNRLRPPVETFHRLEGDHNTAFLVSQPEYTRVMRRFIARVTGPSDQPRDAS